MKLAVFAACRSGTGGLNSTNLPSVAIQQGATTAIGFRDSINCYLANDWTSGLFYRLTLGYSVNTACLELKDSGLYVYSGLDTYIVCGEKTLTFP